MTDQQTVPEPRGPDRPSWLHEACPSWCTREHREDDHPEDRIHQDEGVVIAAVVGDAHPTTLTVTARATELVVQRYRPIPHLTPTWVRIVEPEGGRAPLLLTEETARRLGRALPDAESAQCPSR